jgi:hypothetical protein
MVSVLMVFTDWEEHRDKESDKNTTVWETKMKGAKAIHRRGNEEKFPGEHDV